jgi:hypothetical protein
MHRAGYGRPGPSHVQGLSLLTTVHNYLLPALHALFVYSLFSFRPRLVAVRITRSDLDLGRVFGIQPTLPSVSHARWHKRVEHLSTLYLMISSSLSLSLSKSPTSALFNLCVFSPHLRVDFRVMNALA